MDALIVYEPEKYRAHFKMCGKIGEIEELRLIDQPKKVQRSRTHMKKKLNKLDFGWK